MEFKAGDRVKIEGVLVSSGNSTDYPFSLLTSNGKTLVNFTKFGQDTLSGITVLQLVERVKTKVKKYRVLYQERHSSILMVSNLYYTDSKDFLDGNHGTNVLQLLEATEKEFEE